MTKRKEKILFHDALILITEGESVICNVQTHKKMKNKDGQSYFTQDGKTGTIFIRPDLVTVVPKIRGIYLPINHF